MYLSLAQYTHNDAACVARPLLLLMNHRVPVAVCGESGARAFLRECHKTDVASALPAWTGVRGMKGALQAGTW